MYDVYAGQLRNNDNPQVGKTEKILATPELNNVLKVSDKSTKIL